MLRTVTDTGANASAVCAHVVWTIEDAALDGSVTQSWATGDDVRVRATPCWVCKVQAGQHSTDTRLDDTSGPGSTRRIGIIGASSCIRVRRTTSSCCSGGVGHLIYANIKVPDHEKPWNNRLLNSSRMKWSVASLNA